MIKTKTHDLFISHAWRYHDDWKRLVDVLNAHAIHGWRNFSLPWYDPALDPRTEKGGQIVRWNLETQIMPAHAVVLLASVLSEPGTRKWLDFEVEMARKHRKLIIGLPPWGKDEVSQDVKDRVDEVVSWDAAAILAAVDRTRTPLKAAA